MIEINSQIIKEIMPKRKQNSNKGDFGKVLHICGSNSYIGAGILSAIGSLRVGAGYSILCSEEKAIEHYKNYSADIIYKSHKDFDFSIIKKIIENENISSIVVGCGIGIGEKQEKFISELLPYLSNKNIPTIIDADGINNLSNLTIKKLGGNFILTPHPKELSGLIKIDLNEIINNKTKFLKIAQEKFNSIILLKGNGTLVTDGNENYINTTGNSALAKAGTGDVLSGMIGGFSAQKAPLIKAAILSVYFHGLAAQIYSEKFSEYSMLASDLLDYIPLAIRQ